MTQPTNTSAVQTEATNLAMVEESTLGATTPPTSGWFNLDPNSYGNFGASFKKVPRDPITKSQQLKKGMLTDMDSGLACEFDFTKDNLDRFAPSIWRTAAKHAGNKGQSRYKVTGVTSTGYTVAALGDLTARFLVNVMGCDRAANNGLKLVTSGSTGTETKASGLTTEASPPANAIMEVAGWRGASGDIQLDTDGNLTSTLADFTTMGLNELQWIYIGGADSGTQFATPEYSGAARIAIDGIAAHKLTLDRRSWTVEARAELDLSSVTTNFDTIVEAILAGPDGNDITVAAVADGTAAVKASLDMDAAGNSAHIDTIIQAKTGGTAGNSITVEVITGAPTAAGVLTEVGTHVKLAIKATATATTVAQLETLINTSTLIEVKTTGTGATSLDGTDAFDSVPLSGGAAATAASVAEVSDAVMIHFTPGVTTVAEAEVAINTSTKIRVKTAGTPSAVLVLTDDDFSATNLTGGSDGIDDGSGKTIDIYFTRFFRNVTMDHADYRRPSIVFELEYPTLSAGSPMYEYMLGNMADEWTLNLPLTNKATINTVFKGTQTLALTASRKTGPSAALNPIGTNGVSTATDLQRLRVSELDETGISTDFTSLKLMFKNNVSPEKQLARLGASIMNVGKHMVSVEADCIFTDAGVMNAVRNNTTCTLDVLARNDDFGALIDIQSLTLDSDDRKMEKDKSIKVTSKGTGFENNQSASTSSCSVFAYLPTIAS